jgi:hypothetical protein
MRRPIAVCNACQSAAAGACEPCARVDMTFAASQTNRANRTHSALCVTRNAMKWSDLLVNLPWCVPAIAAGESAERHHWLFGREGPCYVHDQGALAREFSYARCCWAVRPCQGTSPFQSRRGRAVGSVLVCKGS